MIIMISKTHWRMSLWAMAIIISLLVGCGGGGNEAGTPETQPPPSTDPSTDPPTDPAPDPTPDPAPDPNPAPSTAPAINRGADYMGTPEKFNRYYTDPDWQPLRTIYVSREGANTDLSSNSQQSPAPAQYALDRAQGGDKIVFLKDSAAYNGCFELNRDDVNGGTYDHPIVLYAQRNDDDSLGVIIIPCASGRRTAINLEAADYVAVDGFEIEGGYYGVRAVGIDFDQEDHQKGVAIVNCHVYDQYRDPFFTGQSDWAILESNTGHGAGSGDGHGIYLSNGSDWNIVRFNELYDNHSSDFQINADPAFTCMDTGMAYDDTRCDGSALDGLGRGASDFFLVEGNYFHNGRGQGPNFTSVRNSVVRANTIGLYDRHGTSFWQETNNPNLGSKNNEIAGNLFIGDTENRHVLQFAQYSDNNRVEDNIFMGITIDGDTAAPNDRVVLMAVDNTVGNNTYDGNSYIGGAMDGHTVNASEFQTDAFSPDWFHDFPFDRMGVPNDWTPTAAAPNNGFGGWTPLWNR